MESKSRAPRILIAGLGNLLLMDDGVRVHAAQELQKAPPDGAGENNHQDTESSKK